MGRHTRTYPESRGPPLDRRKESTTRPLVLRPAACGGMWWDTAGERGRGRGASARGTAGGDGGTGPHYIMSSPQKRPAGRGGAGGKGTPTGSPRRRMRLVKL